MRSSYDVFGQTRFDQENKLYEMLQTQFNVEIPEEAEELQKMFWQNIKQKRIITSIGEVLPYYVAWTFAGLMMIDRSYGKPAMAFLSLSLGFFEGWSRINYGDEQWDWIFTPFKSWFPPMWTMGEALKLTRSCFPLLLVLLIWVLDNTLDKLSLDEDKLQITTNLLKKQSHILYMCSVANKTSLSMEKGE